MLNRVDGGAADMRASGTVISWTVFSLEEQVEIIFDYGDDDAAPWTRLSFCGVVRFGVGGDSISGAPPRQTVATRRYFVLDLDAAPFIWLLSPLQSATEPALTLPQRAPPRLGISPKKPSCGRHRRGRAAALKEN